MKGLSFLVFIRRPFGLSARFVLAVSSSLAFQLNLTGGLVFRRFEVLAEPRWTSRCPAWPEDAASSSSSVTTSHSNRSADFFDWKRVHSIDGALFGNGGTETEDIPHMLKWHQQQRTDHSPRCNDCCRISATCLACSWRPSSLATLLQMQSREFMHDLANSQSRSRVRADFMVL